MEVARARRGAPNKGFARRPQEFLAWDDWEWEWECGARGRVNKGFARRPQKFLGWKVGGRMQRFLHLEGGGRPYVAIPAFGM